MAGTARQNTVSPTPALSRVEHAYREIKARILTNRYPPGFRALEQEVAEDLGVSRTPVREALIRLENEGLVRLIPRRGMHVLPLAPSDMREIYEVLTAVETMAVELLGKRKPTADDLSALEQALDDMDAALASDDLETWADADDRFHRALLEACGNSRLAAIANTVRDQGHRARLITLRLRPRPVRSNKEHREVLDAIKAGDWARARQMHYKHRIRTSETLTEILEQYQFPQL